MSYADWLQRSIDVGDMTVTDAIGQIATEIAAELDARAIITSTISGATARRVAMHRPITPIIAPSPCESTCRQLALVWGVQPLLVEQFTDTDTMISTAVNAAKTRGLVEEGDLVIITAGVPVGGSGLTNMVKAHRVGEEKGWR